MPVAALESQYADATDRFQKSFAGLALSTAFVGPTDMTQTLREFPIALQRVEEYARRVSTAGAEAPAITV